MRTGSVGTALISTEGFLLEELRAPLADRFSVSLLTRRQLTPADFQHTLEKGCLLDRGPLRKYFAAYEEELARGLSVDGERVPPGGSGEGNKNRLLKWRGISGLARVQSELP